MALSRYFLHSRVQQHTAGKPLSYSELKKLSDEDLIEVLKQGQRDALAVLFDRYHRLVMSIALKILRNAAEAEDMMQEVFFEIYRSVGNFDPKKGITKRWILLYATHRSLNRRCYLNRRKYFDSQGIDDVEAEEVASSPSAWGGLTMEECSRLIEQGMAGLTEKQRETLRLEYFQGYLLSEIANHMNESLHNVRHHHYRGLRKLRMILESSPSLEASVAPTQESVSVKR